LNFHDAGFDEKSKVIFEQIIAINPNNMEELGPVLGNTSHVNAAATAFMKRQSVISCTAALPKPRSVMSF
jgi:hypothetical protein